MTVNGEDHCGKGESLRNISPAGLLKQIPPLRIHFLNQLKLPLPPPFLHLLFAFNGVFHGSEILEPDKIFYRVVFRETLIAAFLMSVDARA